jgi:hypothetical protein
MLDKDQFSDRLKLSPTSWRSQQKSVSLTVMQNIELGSERLVLLLERTHRLFDLGSEQDGKEMTAHGKTEWAEPVQFQPLKELTTTYLLCRICQPSIV